MGYQRSILLINRAFQLRFAIFGCLWIFALSVVYPLVIFGLFEFFFRYLARDPNGPPAEFLVSTRKEVMVLLVAFHVIFVTVTFLVNIFISHRIAGPLHKLKQHFALVKAGHLHDKVVFRKRDHFPEVAAEFNEMVVGLRESSARSVRAIDSAIAAAEGLKASGASADKVESLLLDLRNAKANIPQ